MILMRAITITRAGVGPEIGTFLGPETATSEASAIWAQRQVDMNSIDISQGIQEEL